jgi:predicted transcriptional regulator YdeE
MRTNHKAGRGMTRRFSVLLAAMAALLLAAAGTSWAGVAIVSPSTAAKEVYSQHTVTVHYPREEIPYFPYAVFTITSGPDQGLHQSVMIDDNGDATYTFTNGGKAGQDTIKADVDSYDIACRCRVWAGSGSATVTFTDSTAPKVTSVTPSVLDFQVARATNVTAAFSEKMDPATITKSTFKLFKWSKKGQTWQRIYDTNVGCVGTSSCTQARLDPYASDSTKVLQANAKFKAVVATAAEDINGNALDQDTSKSGNQPMAWTFTTGD